MCGVAGSVCLGAGSQPEFVTAMTAVLTHRGPDHFGFWQQGGVALGHRRLSIIDCAGGHQPMANEDGTIRVSFNGEIYNFEELRTRLEKSGHRFQTRSDTEVIAHAYEQWGPECVCWFRGMFAFALWDDRQKKLLLARDRLGKKPMFYATAGREFVFASELQGLLAHPLVPRNIDFTAIDDYLTYGYIPAPKTAFRGVFKLPPAHCLELSVGAGAPARVWSYWKLEYGPKWRYSEREAAEGLLEVLQEAVRLRLISDVPLGALLSGGTDSSLIVALMSRLGTGPVKTYSVGFTEQNFNELPHARRVAEYYSTDHHEFVVKPQVMEVLPKLVQHYGEPFSDSSAIPTYYVAKLASGHVKVALNGDGGDECFAGYNWYLINAIVEGYRSLPRPLRWGMEHAAVRLPDSLPRRSLPAKVKRFLGLAQLPLHKRYFRWVGCLSPGQKAALYRTEYIAELNGYHAESWLAALLMQAAAVAAEPLDAVLSADVQSYLPFDLLVKMDIATMANSLEARSPFLDHKVMEYCARLPGRHKIRRTTQKYLLKKIAEDLVPRDNLRRRKMGFSIPVDDWVRGELRPLLEDVLLGRSAWIREILDPGAVEDMLRSHAEGRFSYGSQLWALLWLELWHRNLAPPGTATGTL